MNRIFRILEGVRPQGEEIDSAFFVEHDAFDRTANPCHTCKARCPRIFPASLEYQGGKVKEFVGTYAMTVCVEEVAREMSKAFPEITIVPTPIYQGPDFRNPRARRLKYKGPKLCELWFRTLVPFNPEISTLKSMGVCPECGWVSYQVDQTALPKRQERIGDRYEWVPPKPRLKGRGAIIPREAIGPDTFFYFGHSGFAMCLETGKEFIERRGWKDVMFIDSGEVV